MPAHKIRKPKIARNERDEPKLDHHDHDPKAVAADQAAAHTSDRTDGRDGVDGSDSIGRS